MQGLFDLTIPEHLLKKLEREYEKLRENPADADHAFNFFVTAEHIPDWLARSDPKALGGKSIKTFKRGHPITRICENLANGAKHFIPKVSPEKQLNISVQRTERKTRGYVKPGYVKPGYVREETILQVYLTPGEVDELRRSGVPDAAEAIDAPLLAAKVLEFWRKHWQDIQP
jgi:hypothetical protein